jgi:hypothetical protein
MVDAELGDGDVSQITQAITNALRPPVTNMSMKRIAASAQPNVDQNSDATDVEVVEAELEEIEALKPIASKPKTQRKVGVKPNVIDLDIDSDPPCLRWENQKATTNAISP